MKERRRENWIGWRKVWRRDTSLPSLVDQMQLGASPAHLNCPVNSKNGQAFIKVLIPHGCDMPGDNGLVEGGCLQLRPTL